MLSTVNIKSLISIDFENKIPIIPPENQAIARPVKKSDITFACAILDLFFITMARIP